MDELDFDPDKFVFVYPVWICHPARSDQVIGGNVPGGGQFVAIFTDEDIADRFISARGLKGKADLSEITNQGNLAGLLSTLQADGFTHVAVDPSGDSVKDMVKRIEIVIRHVLEE